MSLSNLAILLGSFWTQSIYQKDFIQEYLLARAITAGVHPYAPLSDLAAQFIGPLPVSTFPHQSTHPPPMAILALPFALFTYFQAAVIWFILQLIFTVASVWLLLRYSGARPSATDVTLASASILIWYPFGHSLSQGQLMILLLLLLILAWLNLREGRDWRGGIWLGAMLALKLTGWPILLFLALRRKWRAVAAAAAAGVTLNLFAAAVIGIESSIFYYREIGSVVAVYKQFVYNSSPFSLGWRILAGTHPATYPVPRAEPLINAHDLAPYASALLPAVLLAIAVALALRARSFDAAFGILVCVSILVSPVVWAYYYVLLLIPLAVLWRKLSILNFPLKEKLLALCLGAWLFFANAPLTVSLRFLMVEDTLPPAAVLLGYLSTAAATALMLFLWRLDVKAVGENDCLGVKF